MARKSRDSEWEVCTVILCPQSGREEVYIACHDGWRRELFAWVESGERSIIVMKWEEACEAANRLEDISDKLCFVRPHGGSLRREYPNTRAKRAALREAWLKAEEEYAAAQGLYVI